MGGRGSSSSGGGGGGGGAGAGGSVLVAKPKQQNQPSVNAPKSTVRSDSSLLLTPDQMKPDYTNNGNQNLINYQNMTDKEAGHMLHDNWDNTDLNQIQQQSGDQWGFYNLPMQKTVSSLNLNDKPQVMSEADFDKYVQQTGSTVIYRGWESGVGSVDRFKNSPNNHVGNGINGDGYYWSTDLQTAKNYAANGGRKGVVTKGALSPSARVVDVEAVRKNIRKSSNGFQSSLKKAGRQGQRSYPPNIGEGQMALKMGYNAIDVGWAVIPLTRDAMVISDKLVKR